MRVLLAVLLLAGSAAAQVRTMPVACSFGNLDVDTSACHSPDPGIGVTCVAAVLDNGPFRNPCVVLCDFAASFYDPTNPSTDPPDTAKPANALTFERCKCEAYAGQTVRCDVSSTATLRRDTGALYKQAGQCQCQAEPPPAAAPTPRTP